VAARSSQVRLRLSRWEEGGLKKNQWPRLASVRHPEVPQQVASDLYLGYGPVTLPRGAQQPTLKSNAAIQPGEEAELLLAYPESVIQRLDRALWLMHQYGTAGGRSRNGWGSYELAPVPIVTEQGTKAPLRNWRECLALDWPHAIGQDEQGALIWQTTPHDDWKVLMKTLAIIKIGLRTHFRFATGDGAYQPDARHWLSYPVTRHSVQPWGNNARLPNQLRFKVRRNSDGKLIGVIFHMPHLPPPAFNPDRQAIVAVWTQVHRFLDNPAQQLKRIAE
jgi:CRISPR-associated protein Cmr1